MSATALQMAIKALGLAETGRRRGLRTAKATLTADGRLQPPLDLQVWGQPRRPISRLSAQFFEQTGQSGQNGGQNTDYRGEKKNKVAMVEH
jgi:hypothetical protein